MPCPSVSIVIPTLNAAVPLEPCLAAVRAQRYPRERVELVIADAGSTDDTLAVARRHGADRVAENPLRTGEAGKTAGIKASTGELIALIDSDNIVDDPDWLARMTAPFADPAIVAAEPLEYTWRAGDPALTRYFAMLGMNDPLCLFLGNYDRRSLVTGRWTGLNVEQADRGDYLELRLDEAQLPTIGANGFVLRRELLARVRWDPYFFDIDVMHQAVAAGLNRVAKVKCGIVHLYCRRLRDFARKQDRRVRDFLFFADRRERTYPWSARQRRGIARFCLYSVLTVPLAAQAARGWSRRRDPAWLYHLPCCWITLWVYGRAAARKALGMRPQARSRTDWRQ